MVRKEFFCGAHRAEAVLAAKKENREINRWHTADQKNRAEQAKKGNTG